MNTMTYKFPGHLLLFLLVVAYAFLGAGKAHANWEAEWEKNGESSKRKKARSGSTSRLTRTPCL